MTERRFDAVVVGGTGYGGGEMIRRLLLHPAVRLTRVVSVDRVGESLGAVHPNLEGMTDLRFEELPAEEAAREADVVLLGLPHDVSARVVPTILRETSAKVVDMSGAFRTDDAAAYARWYGQEHPNPEVLPQLVYGLTEMERARIREARGVANPGCFATCIELGLLPFAREGWLHGAARTVAMTGSSGSGAAASPGTHHPVRSVNLKTYRPLSHPQTVEIVETLRRAGAGGLELEFVPVSAPLSRGIFASTFIEVPASVDEAAARAAVQRTFGGERFVRMPKERLPEVAAVAGSNHAEVGFVLGPARGSVRTLTCFGALDNLIKGGAGQAIQNMNLLLGLEESLALEDPGSWP